MKPEDQAALEAAQRAFLAWLDSDWPHTARHPFLKLRNAAKELSVALAPFLADEGQGAFQANLLTLMQRRELHQHASEHYRRALIELHARTLPALIAACSARVGKGRGREAEPKQTVWIQHAACAWADRIGAPSAALRGRFWRAIERFQLQADARVPRVSRDVVALVLKGLRTGGPMGGSKAPA